MTTNKVRKYRLKLDISGAELARRCGMKQPDISAIERGKKHPYAGWRKKIAQELGVSEEILFPGVSKDDK